MSNSGDDCWRNMIKRKAKVEVAATVNVDLRVVMAQDARDIVRWKSRLSVPDPRLQTKMGGREESTGEGHGKARNVGISRYYCTAWQYVVRRNKWRYFGWPYPDILLRTVSCWFECGSDFLLRRVMCLFPGVSPEIFMVSLWFYSKSTFFE